MTPPDEARVIADVIHDALAASLGDAYDCTRVWSAWSYGTMGEDDFEPVRDRIDEIVQSVVAAIRRFEDTSHAE